MSNAAEVVRLARAGDAASIAVWQEAGGFLNGPLAKALTDRRTFHRLPELVPAELGDEAGRHGAAQLALDLLTSEDETA